MTYKITYWDTETQTNITKEFSTITIFSIVDFPQEQLLVVNILEWPETISVYTPENYNPKWSKTYINNFLVEYFTNKSDK